MHIVVCQKYSVLTLMHLMSSFRPWGEAESMFRLGERDSGGERDDETAIVVYHCLTT